MLLAVLFTVAAFSAHDYANAITLGNAAQVDGLVVSYQVDQETNYLDINVGDKSGEYAEHASMVLCQFAHVKQQWDEAWTVRAFLANSLRPVSQCTTK